MHSDAGNQSGADSDELALWKRMTRFHEEEARQDDMLHLEGTNRFHDMTMDTNNTLVVIDPFNNQLKHEDKERTSDVKGRPCKRKQTRTSRVEEYGNCGQNFKAISTRMIPSQKPN